MAVNPERVRPERNPFRVQPIFIKRVPQGCRYAPTAGLKLANAFGVLVRLKLANAFGV